MGQVRHVSLVGFEFAVLLENVWINEGHKQKGFIEVEIDPGHVVAGKELTLILFEVCNHGRKLGLDALHGSLFVTRIARPSDTVFDIKNYSRKHIYHSLLLSIGTQ